MSRTSRLAVITALSAATLGFSFSADTVHADQPAVYVVKQGDSLFGIAGKLKVSVDSLLSANGITLTSVILPGQQLQVPGAGGGSGGSGGSGPAPASSGTYTVKAGDSLSAIAQRHRVSLSALLTVNSMTVKSLILPGQSIALPAGAAAPAAQAPAATGGSTSTVSSGTYTVKAGDSLSAIAQRHGVSLGSLLTANSMTLTSLIVPGQVVKLPAGATAPSVAQQPSSQPAQQPAVAGGPTYTIKAGDSLSGIAQRHHITLAALLAANGMTVSSLILPGQTLQLPAGTATTSNPATTPAASGNIATVIAYAQAQLGKPYVFNTAGPDTYDCSGLTKAAYRTVGVSLVHQSSAQARQGTAVDFINEPIQPGDLIFLATRGNETINHVGIAISGTQYIHAASPTEGVKVSKMPSLGSIVAVRRMISG